MEQIQQIQSESKKQIPILTDHQRQLLTELNNYLWVKTEIFSDTLENQEKFIKNIVNNTKKPIPTTYFAYAYMFENIKDLFSVINKNRKIAKKNNTLEKIKIFLTKNKYTETEEEMSAVDRWHSILFWFLYFKNQKPFYKDSFVVRNHDMSNKEEIINLCYKNWILVDSWWNKIK